MSLNLHQIVRCAITSNFADETVLLVRSAGATFSKGRSTPSYTAGVEMKAQVQTLSGDDLKVIGETERTERDRKFYLWANPGVMSVPAGQIRVSAARTGDYIYRSAYGTYWKIYNVAEDFSTAGWVQVLASEQVDVPAGVIKAVVPDEPEEPDVPDVPDVPDTGD